MFTSYCVLCSSCPQSLYPECGNMFHILYCGLFRIQLYLLLLLCALCRPDQPQSPWKMRRIWRRRRKKRKRRISASQVHLMWSWWPSHPHLSYQVNHKVNLSEMRLHTGAMVLPAGPGTSSNLTLLGHSIVVLLQSEKSSLHKFILILSLIF